MTDILLAPARRKGERTAAAIGESALDLFSRLGFERVTMAEIAEAAGVSQATLHYHYADKDQLWRSAIDALSAVIAEEERMMTAARDAPAIVQLRMAMRFFVELSWKHPALGRIVALEGMAGGERLRLLVDHLIGPRNRRFAKLARLAIADGALRPFPPEHIVIMLQTGAVGAINLAPLMKANFGYDATSAKSRAAHAEMVVEALLRGLETEHSKGRPS